LNLDECAPLFELRADLFDSCLLLRREQEAASLSISVAFDPKLFQFKRARDNRPAMTAFKKCITFSSNATLITGARAPGFRQIRLG
jgi:hypothetical protein